MLKFKLSLLFLLPKFGNVVQVAYICYQQRITKQQNRIIMTTGDKINGYKVVGVKNIVHGKFFPNKKILAEVYVKAKRGEKYFSGYVFSNGACKIDFSYSFEAPAIIGDLVYYGESGTFVNPIAIV